MKRRNKAGRATNSQNSTHGLASLDDYSDKQHMNPEVIKKQTSGPGPFIIRTSDGKQYQTPHGEFIGFTRHYMFIEDEKGGVDIVDPLHVVAIRPVRKRRTRAA